MARVAVSQIDAEWESVDRSEARTGRSRWSWRKDAYKGKIGFSKVGTRLFLRVEDVDRVMREGYRPAVGESVTA
jgi:hypothetical protein